MDRPVLVPAGGGLAGERRLVAVRTALLAARPAARLGGGLESLHAVGPVRGRPAGNALAARTRAVAARCGCRRPRFRDRPLPRDAEPRPPARADVAPARPRPVGVRTCTGHRPLVVVGDLVGGARLDPPVRPGPSRARGDPLLCPLRAVPVDRAERRRGNRRRSDRGRSRGRADPADRHRRIDRLGRAVARRGARVLGDRARLPLAAHPARRRGVRLPRVADAAARDRRARLAAHGSRAAACGCAGHRRGRAGAAGSRHPLPAVLAALARVLAAALSARTGAADADRVPLPGRAARDRDRLGRAAARGATHPADSHSARSSRSSCSPTCTSVPSIPPRPTGPTPPTRP